MSRYSAWHLFTQDTDYWRECRAWVDAEDAADAELLEDERLECERYGDEPVRLPGLPKVRA